MTLKHAPDNPLITGPGQREINIADDFSQILDRVVFVNRTNGITLTFTAMSKKQQPQHVILKPDQYYELPNMAYRIEGFDKNGNALKRFPAQGYRGKDRDRFWAFPDLRRGMKEGKAV
jgi:hypothetical protein